MMNPKKLVRQVMPATGIRVAEETYRKGRIYALQAKFGFPARGARVIGVTGTNGKTTTCNYINEMLKSAGFKTAMFTTAVVEMAGDRQPNHTHRTVPLTADLMAFFKTAKEHQVDFVVLEVSSQALHQHKLVGIPFEISVMTNLTQEHLDYHHSMQEYAAAKARLFGKYCNPKHVVLNRDDEWYETFESASVGSVISYGQHGASTARMKKPDLTTQGGEVDLNYKNTQLSVKTPLLGEFNVYNAVAAACVGLTLELNPQVIEQGVAALQTVPGRMEQIVEGQPFDVIVDYAVTPDSLEKVLVTLRPVTEGRIMIVFGATGDRDRTKRPVMGQVVAGLADRIFLTDDETYTEDGASIRRAVMEGIVATKGQDKATEIADRRDAIAAAFKEAKAGDVVLLTGIGHQDYRVMGTEKQPWDERQVARELLKEYIEA